MGRTVPLLMKSEAATLHAALVAGTAAGALPACLTNSNGPWRRAVPPFQTSSAAAVPRTAPLSYHMTPEPVITIMPVAPFNFRRTLRFALRPPLIGNGREFEPLLDYWEDEEYRRVLEVRDGLALYGVSENGQEGSLHVRIICGPSGALAREEVERAVRRQLATGLDLRSFHRVAGGDPVLARLVSHFRGMRIPQLLNPYEALISAILEQQINLSFAHQVKRALIQNYGRFVEWRGKRYGVFPSPGVLAASTPEQLRTLQVSGPKAKYIIAISRAVVEGRLDLDALCTLDPPAAHERLVALKGVGAWTAQYVGLRSLGHLDCLPAADVGLQNAIRYFYGMRRQPAAARVEAMARAWRGWRSYAAFYLWLTFWEDASWKEERRAEIRVLRKRIARQPAKQNRNI